MLKKIFTVLTVVTALLAAANVSAKFRDSDEKKFVEIVHSTQKIYNSKNEEIANLQPGIIVEGRLAKDGIDYEILNPIIVTPIAFKYWDVVLPDGRCGFIIERFLIPAGGINGIFGPPLDLLLNWNVCYVHSLN